jgi:glutamate mutase epsilon subunit
MANFGTYRGGEIISQGVSRALDRHQRQKEVDLNEAYRRDTLKENTRQFEENLKINQDRNKILQYEHDKKVALDDLNNNYIQPRGFCWS